MKIKLTVEGDITTDAVNAQPSQDLVINGSSGTGLLRCTLKVGRGNVVIE